MLTRAVATARSSPRTGPARSSGRQLASPIRVANADLPPFEVDVGPLQRDDLADSHPTFTAQ